MGGDIIRFIRKGGRIIPIRSKKDSKQGSVKQGSAYIASGAGVAAGSGFVAGKLFKKAVKTGRESQSMTKTAKFAFKTGDAFGDRVGTILLRGSARRAKKTAKQLAASKATFKFGAGFLGGLLIGKGITEIMEAQLGRQLHDAEELASTTAGFAAVKLGHMAFKKGVGKNILKVLSRGKL